MASQRSIVFLRTAILLLLIHASHCFYLPASVLRTSEDLAGCVWLLRKRRNNERHCCLSFVFGVVLACVEGKRRIS
ncbi:hypothetical protein CK203_005018 [Vitis vinifera]|uniref:Secreted protein n=1 Tax=Vitis vinifera TaxID=29760 RepID=A0A438KE95_VITVI|nr:hypothetical protein CK203_005018 [Vitis vinifera]